MSKELCDINQKPSITRKLLKKYTPYFLLFDAFIILLVIVLNRDIGDNTAFIIVSINGIFFGTPYAKMGVEFFSRKK